MKWLFIFVLFISNTVLADYQRNTAKPVNKVIYGQVDSVRYVTQTEIRQVKSSGWKPFLGAIAGGVIGHQFGGGTGKVVATVAGTAAGAAIGHQAGKKQYIETHELVELLVKTDDGNYLDIIQDVDPAMLFERGSDVRILYFDDGVRVDIAY
ncbi:glycine zipper 2TM domain-containing protein [Vibrio sp.]|nr:glycine zipper 2TM domain-containing protein [Vibrio sp.]